MLEDYAEFLKSKTLVVPNYGFEVAPNELISDLFDFQRDLVRWSLKKGRAALFATTGMGKTRMYLAWASAIHKRTGGNILVLAPLGVVLQSVEEGYKVGVHVTYARNQSQAANSGITITNYEMLQHFDPSKFIGVVLDESSILKAFAGKIKKALVAAFKKTPFRLCCTATPSPNDTVELTNHADFLGVMNPRDMLTIFFTTKGVTKTDGRFRLKKHARDAFFKWLSSWAMSLTKPGDLGYDDGDYALPPLTITPVIVDSNWTAPGQLPGFTTALKGVVERSQARRASLEQRVSATADLISRQPKEQWIIWCGLNDEAAMIKKALETPHSRWDCFKAENGEEIQYSEYYRPYPFLGTFAEVRGNDSPEYKAETLSAFAKGEIQVLITKTQIAGFGLNFQSCARMIFLGLGDSYEEYFQAIRRCYRFGQRRPVEAYIVLSEIEQVVFDNVLRKEREAEELMRELVAHVAQFEQAEIKGLTGQVEYLPTMPMVLPDWLRSYEEVIAC
jgi:hypothetical protein